MRKSLLPLLLLLPAMAAHGFDAYFYTGNTNTPVYVAKDAVTVSFLPETTCVRLSNFATSEVENSKFDYMLFRQKASTSSVANIGTSAISAEVRGGRLYVKSDSKLKDVTVYTASGVAVAKAETDCRELSLDLSSLAPGLYVVGVSSEKEVKTLKIINK